MKRIHFFLILLFICSSCEIHKRKYRKGWHLEWASNKGKEQKPANKPSSEKNNSSNEIVITQAPVKKDTAQPSSKKLAQQFIADNFSGKLSQHTFNSPPVLKAYKEQLKNIQVQKQNPLQPSKRSVPYLPLYLLIAAIILIPLAFVIANNLIIDY